MDGWIENDRRMAANCFACVLNIDECQLVRFTLDMELDWRGGVCLTYLLYIECVTSLRVQGK